MIDPYEILGVQRGATGPELKKAFHKLARECHPDSDPDNPWAEDEFKALSAAYELLSDPKRRALFDRGEISGDGSKQPTRRATKEPPRTGAHNRTSQANPNATAGSQSKTAGLKIKGADVEYTLHVDFMEAAKGAVRHISMATGKRIKVTIPPATEEGCILRLKGQGMSGFGGAADGEAYVEIFVDPDPVFRREKNHIHVDIPVTLSEAVLGGKINVPTIDGKVSVTVPKGSNTGTQLRLKGKGLSDGSSSDKIGDQLVHLTVVLPKTPDKSLIRFLEKWSPDHPYQVRDQDSAGAREKATDKAKK
ncbi:MAG: J domain-containing protein [Rhodospirillales bacterium]|nr:J domain-containing protein [Rhodospirillales bacterium]